MRFRSEKYAKFAYSSRYGISASRATSGSSSRRPSTECSPSARTACISASGRRTKRRSSPARCSMRVGGRTRRHRRGDLAPSAIALARADSPHSRARAPPLHPPRARFAIPPGRSVSRRRSVRREDRRAATAVGEAFQPAFSISGSTVPRRGHRAQGATPNTNHLRENHRTSAAWDDRGRAETLLLTAVVALADAQAGLRAWGSPSAPDPAEIKEALFAAGAQQVSAIAWRQS